MESYFELDRDSFEVQKAWRQFDAPFSSETLKETDSHTSQKLESSDIGLKLPFQMHFACVCISFKEPFNELEQRLAMRR